MKTVTPHPRPLSHGERGAIIQERQITNYEWRAAPARELRRRQTPAESRLWGYLRDQRLGGYKFRRQFPAGPFFADFCCVKGRFIVELDGPVHRYAEDSDENRTRYLKRQGYYVLRFDNQQVLDNPRQVCNLILQRLHIRTRTPLPAGEGGPTIVGTGEA